MKKNTPQESTQPIGWVDDTQIDAWKAKHICRTIHEVFTIDEKDQEHVTYLRPSGIKELQVLGNYVKKGEELKGAEVLFNTLRLGGSDDIIKYEELRKMAIMTSNQLHKSTKSRLGKR